MVSPPCAKLLASPDLAALGSAFSCCDASVSAGPLSSAAAPIAAAPVLDPTVAPILTNGSTSSAFILAPSASPSAGEDTPPSLSCGRPDSITIRQAQAITALPTSLASVAGLDVLEVHGTLRGHVDVSRFDTLRRLVLSNNVDLVLDPGKSKSPLSSSPNLRELDLSNNGIEGEFPKGVLGKGQLQLLNLASNRLVGRIPNTLASSLPRLRSLDLAQNQLTGTVPSLRALATLQTLHLANNQFTDLHPDTLPDTLQDLDVAHNQLTGILALETWATTLKSVSVYDNPRLSVRLGDTVFKDLASLDLRKVKAVHFGVRAAVPFPQAPGFTCQVDPATACIRSAGADVAVLPAAGATTATRSPTSPPDADAASSPTRRLVAGGAGADPVENAADAGATVTPMGKVIYLWKLCNVAKRCVTVDPTGLDSDLATASGDDPGTGLPSVVTNSGTAGNAGQWAVILTATVSVLFAVVVLLVMHILRQNRRTRRIKAKLDRATHRTEFQLDPPPPILSGAAPTVVAPLDSDSELELVSPNAVAYDVPVPPPPAVVRAWAMYPQPRPAVAGEEVALRAIPSAGPRGDLLSLTTAAPMAWPTAGANCGGKVHPLIAGFQPSMGSVSTAVLSSSPVTDSAPPLPSAWTSRAPTPPPIPAAADKVHPLITGWHPSAATVATVVIPPPPSSPITDVPPLPSTSPWTSRAPTPPPSTPTVPPAAVDPDDAAAAMAAWPYLAQTGWGEFMAVAVYPHTPTMRDEIALVPGDTVWVEVAYRDGWAAGVNLTRNVQGVFPLVCLRPEDEYAPPPGVPFMGGGAGAGWCGMPWGVEGGGGQVPPWAAGFMPLSSMPQDGVPLPRTPPPPPTSPVEIPPPPPAAALPNLWPPFPPPPPAVPDVKLPDPDSDSDENHPTHANVVSGASSSSATLTNPAPKPKHVRPAAAARVPPIVTAPALAAGGGEDAETVVVSPGPAREVCRGVEEVCRGVEQV
ncbi:hypothetical protein AMAG_17131 [Allomyces macrogynus ATCC 38327]|uniref:SH3 domain-containing protein n=1 Tax=Allomyces macrogynus (strain ATCC 38327) TaxID=578462 RepID=A0A0L0TDB3_ALLM3|nr:hypothetical protein AMAG_17131 [Allomyces macrogynus ATCC 38327]|eukprot:KNE72893.1 hypothetical protein AMAG_17131 [Allomyces macrogynus ATCC 38327]